MNLRSVILGVVTVGVISLIMMTAACESKYEGIPRIGIDETKSMIGSPDVKLVDVRAAKDWQASDSKIKGAVREDPDAIAEWASKYPKDKTIVFYCA